jgi:hypothetical protein
MGFRAASRAERGRALAEAAAWAGAALVPVVLVLGRNQAIDGTLMPGAGPSTIAWWVNLGAVLRALLGEVVGERAWAAQAAVYVLLVGGALLLAWRRRDGARRGALPSASTAVLAWTLGYLLFLVAESSLREFDPIGARLVLPASVPAAIVACGVITHGWRVPARAAGVVLCGALAFAAVREVATAREVPPGSTAQEIADSPRLAWLVRHTGPRDLVVGDDDMIDVAFYVRRRTISFVDWPGSDPPSPERLRAWCLLHRGEFDRAWIVLNDRWPHARDWGRRLGPFFARLATGRDTLDAGVWPATVLEDGIVYRYDPGGR